MIEATVPVVSEDRRPPPWGGLLRSRLYMRSGPLQPSCSLHDTLGRVRKLRKLRKLRNTFMHATECGEDVDSAALTSTLFSHRSKGNDVTMRSFVID